MIWIGNVGMQICAKKIEVLLAASVERQPVGDHKNCHEYDPANRTEGVRAGYVTPAPNEVFFIIFARGQPLKFAYHWIEFSLVLSDNLFPENSDDLIDRNRSVNPPSRRW